MRVIGNRPPIWLGAGTQVWIEFVDRKKARKVGAYCIETYTNVVSFLRSASFLCVRGHISGLRAGARTTMKPMLGVKLSSRPFRIIQGLISLEQVARSYARRHKSVFFTQAVPPPLSEPTITNLGVEPPARPTLTTVSLRVAPAGWRPEGGCRGCRV